MSETPKFGSNESHILNASAYISEIQNDTEKRLKQGIPEVLQCIADYATAMRNGAEVNLVLIGEDQEEDMGTVTFQSFVKGEDGWQTTFKPLPEGQIISVPVGKFNLPVPEAGQQEL